MSRELRSRVITESLGGSPLSQAIQARRLPTELQAWSPVGVDEWREQVTRVRTDGVWLDRLRPAISPGGVAKQRIERVASERGVVVTTGQQPGLFGGPLYTLAKALTALGLSDTLERELGVPAAPVFWAATDDADFAEARVAYAADASGLHEMALTDAPQAGTPMSRAPLRDVAPLLAMLQESCGSAAHESYFELAKAFEEGRTVGDAYVELLRGLLEPLGISVLDASSEAYLAAARPVLAEALNRASAIASAVAERTAAIRRQGFDPQVEDDRGLSLVFAIRNGIKRRITVEEAATFDDRTAKKASLAPNVLLRPIVERDMLPTVGYVAGPGEIAYFLQSNAVATALGRQSVVAVPRWSCTVLEPFAVRALERLQLGYHEVRDLSGVTKKIAIASLPPNVSKTWGNLEEQLRNSIRDLGEAVTRESLLPLNVIEGLGRSLKHKLDRAERRLLAAVKRRDERIHHDLMVASSSLFPLNKRQERVLNYIPMLARGGEELMSEMRRAATSHAQSLVRTVGAETLAAR
jgi:bacillithiol biosynthesis cysteine-adding enzyme BshC